ncbi:MAG: hypothetical protein IT176_00560 [Acidobacteria bacterium]|nr:hypothetical protein [Acidobacteriota bacterium]
MTNIREQIRRHLLDSYTVRRPVERVLDELDAVREEARFAGWNGYGAKALQTEAYQNAKLFLEALPTTAPSPEVSADPDGEVALDWVFGERKALTVSIGAAGRCTFAWMRGARTYRGTDWLDDDGIPAPIADALWRLVRELADAPRNR